MRACERHSWPTALGILLLVLAANTVSAQTAPPSVPSTPPAASTQKKPKTKATTAVKKSKPAVATAKSAAPKPIATAKIAPKPLVQKPAAVKPAVKLAKAQPAKTATPKAQPQKSQIKKKPAPPPMKPGAEIPELIETASVFEGCLEPSNLPNLATHLGIDENHLNDLLSEQHLLSTDKTACTQYAAITGGEGGVASAVFARADNTGGAPSIVAIRKTADGVTVTPAACDCPDTSRSVYNVPAREAANLYNDVMAGIPKEVHWQLEVLLPKMLARVYLERTLGITDPVSDNVLKTLASVEFPATSIAATQETTEPAVSIASPSLDNAYSVRVVLRRDSYTAPERLESVEIIEAATGKRVDGMWWLDRPGGQGVFAGMEGITYERMLWQSPVKYTMKSRGVGQALSTYRQKVPAKKGSGAKDTYRYVQVRENHMGVDMIAAKGVEVHAVSDATVSFAGRMGGYGNLIILDHGRGYQTYYAHLSKINKEVKVGATIARSEIIGLVGSTGHSTAPHLHFEMRKDAKYIDPFDETHQVELWILSADDQERLAMELLAQSIAPAPPIIASTPTDVSTSDLSPNDNK